MSMANQSLGDLPEWNLGDLYAGPEDAKLAADIARAEALARLQALVDRAAFVPKTRRPTRPTRGSQIRRVDEKTRRGQVKVLRGRGPTGDG